MKICSVLCVCVWGGGGNPISRLANIADKACIRKHEKLGHFIK